MRSRARCPRSARSTRPARGCRSRPAAAPACSPVRSSRRPQVPESPGSSSCVRRRFDRHLLSGVSRRPTGARRLPGRTAQKARDRETGPSSAAWRRPRRRRRTGCTRSSRSRRAARPRKARRFPLRPRTPTARPRRSRPPRAAAAPRSQGLTRLPNRQRARPRSIRLRSSASAAAPHFQPPTQSLASDARSPRRPRRPWPGRCSRSRSAERRSCAADRCRRGPTIRRHRSGRTVRRRCRPGSPPWRRCR